MFKKLLLSIGLIIASAVLAFTILIVLLEFGSTPIPLHNASLSASFWDRGHVIATGTWTMPNEQIADPIQSSEIRCVKQEGNCYEAIAKLSSEGYLTAELYTRAIASWTDSNISFVDQATCVKYVYTIDRKSEQIVGRRMRMNPLPPGCEYITADVRLILVDGSSVWRRESERKRPVALTVLLESGVLVAAIFGLIRIWRHKSPRIMRYAGKTERPA